MSYCKTKRKGKNNLHNKQFIGIIFSYSAYLVTHSSHFLDDYYHTTFSTSKQKISYNKNTKIMNS